jgi:hypothetical protein
VSQIFLNDAFRMLVEKAGLTPDAAVAALNDQTKRDNGKLDLWCNGNLLKRPYIRQCLHFELGDNAIVVIGQAGVGWGRLDNIPAPHDRTVARRSDASQPKTSNNGTLYVFELDADQVEALIAKLVKSKPGPKPKPKPKPKPEPKPRGPKPHPLKQPILDEANRRRRAGEPLNKMAADLLVWAGKQFPETLLPGSKTRLPADVTIRTWLRDRNSR